MRMQMMLGLPAAILVLAGKAVRSRWDGARNRRAVPAGGILEAESRADRSEAQRATAAAPTQALAGTRIGST
jgi:hypothetical protein